jgi:hypothetical protein
MERISFPEGNITNLLSLFPFWVSLGLAGIGLGWAHFIYGAQVILGPNKHVLDYLATTMYIIC